MARQTFPRADTRWRDALQLRDCRIRRKASGALQPHAPREKLDVANTHYSCDTLSNMPCLFP